MDFNFSWFIDMDFNFSRFVGFFLVYVIFFFLGYFFLRDLLWSIVWCDKKGKKRSLKKLRQNRSFIERIKMDYLGDFVKEHKRDFNFWITIKKIYVVIETVLFGFYFVFSYFILKGYSCKFLVYSINFIVFQAIAFCFVIGSQVIGRETKYDRIRLQRKHNQKRWW